MSRNQLNLALLALVAGLTLTVVLTQDEETPKVPVLAGLSADAVDRIAIRHPGSEEIRLEKADGIWHLTAPGQARAEAVEVAALTDLAELESKRQLKPADVSLADLELEPAKYEIQLNDRLLQFGGIEPLEYERYILADDTIHLLSDPPSAALDADFSDLVSKQILPAGRQIVGIELPELSLNKDDSGWSLSPPQADVSTDQMQALVDGWSRARALWNEKPKADADYTDKPKIRLRLDDGSPVELVLVDRQPQLILAQPEARVHHHLSKALADELLQLPEAAVADPVSADTES